MGITQQQWKELTESPFFKFDIGTPVAVKMQNWRYDVRSYKDKPEEKVPHFVADVIEVNNVPLMPSKEFASGNRILNKMLMQAVFSAEIANQSHIFVQVQRIDKTHYNLVDLSLVMRPMGGA